MFSSPAPPEILYCVDTHPLGLPSLPVALELGRDAPFLSDFVNGAFFFFFFLFPPPASVTFGSV